MGFIQAVKGSIGGSLADQWKDFYGPKSNVSATAGVFPGVPMGTNNGRGANYKGNENIITNGSKIVVPEGTALVTIQDGAITGIITEAGGYEYTNDNPNAKSIFAGDSPVDALVKQSWERFKFGGVPGTQQLIFYVNMKEIPNNRFGTQSEIYWDDAYFGTQVGAVTRGTYTLKIADPILFIKNFVPVVFVSPGAPEFDFADMDNPAGEQLFNEVVGSLSAAFSNYTNDPSKGNRMSRIQGDQIGFAQALSKAVDDGYQWRQDRGLEIVKTAIMSIEYDEDTKLMMKDVKRADALSGTRGNSFMQQSVARGMQAAGETGGGANMAFMGMGMGAAGNVMGGMQQPNNPGTYQPGFGQQPQQPNDQMHGQHPNDQMYGQQPQQPVDPTAKLIEMKKLLDAGVITQEEFDRIKMQLLGL
ncbi:MULTISPECIES: SPFH domain-containing protein [Mogibacterium]|uniref:Membrane protein, PF09851 family n=2 Tax=Mogibacterium timidum TaxID=35519 RepID=X8JA05_9FIRM|nr:MULTISPECIES: SPFH domain-containing protein [Mogibacterium]EJU20644.1 membrane protein, PF09851 family [Mogibacterium sp. CM50]EUC58026.1 membrane protein, PF09851 family [Mogibacterium timidum ATCC 33093]NWO23709.1 SPFH domain-containing protein [Mogibacterium timidum]